MGDFKQQELQQQRLKSARIMYRKLDSASYYCTKKNFFDYKLILKINLDLKKSDRFYIFPKGHMVRMELNCFVEKSSSLKREQVPYLLMYNEFMCDTLVTGYVFNRHCINNIGFHMNTLIKLVILNSPNKNNKDIPATDFWRLLQDHITKKYLSI